MHGGRTCGLQKLLNIVAGITTAKNCIAGNQYLRASLHHRPYRIKSDAAIHLNTESKMALSTQFRKIANLSQGTRDEFLPPEAGIHRHDQYIIHNIQNV